MFYTFRQIADIPDKGKGVLASINIKRDDVVGEYTGEILSGHEAKLREEQYLADYPEDKNYKAYPSSSSTLLW